jgi:hypothetical protein
VPTAAQTATASVYSSIASTVASNMTIDTSTGFSNLEEEEISVGGKLANGCC